MSTIATGNAKLEWMKSLTLASLDWLGSRTSKSMLEHIVKYIDCIT